MSKKMSATEFDLPSIDRISGRSTSITSAFFKAITPVVRPTKEEIERALKILGMEEKCVCAYCGGVKSEWDHLRPIVKNKHPTGYITEIANLVPSCGKCNQSKGNKDWREWMNGPAKGSPKSRNILDIEARMKRLQEYEEWKKPTEIDYPQIAGEKDWNDYLALRDEIISKLKEAQAKADSMKSMFKAKQ